MNSFKGWMILVAVGLVTFATVPLATFLFTEEEEKKETVVRVTQKSDINTVEAVFNTNFKIPKGKPDIVWQDPTSGETLSEEFITLSYPKSKQAAVFKALRQEGLRRVYEECRGIVKKDNTWSLGYCTYRPAPAALKG